LKDTDQVAETLHHRLPLAELVRIVEIRKSLRARLGVGVNQRLNNLRVDLVADILLPLRATMSLKLALGGMVTGGAKSSESQYLSDTYLMKSMKRT
jgi:hypothetical protein